MNDIPTPKYGAPSGAALSLASILLTKYPCIRHNITLPQDIPETNAAIITWHTDRLAREMQLYLARESIDLYKQCQALEAQLALASAKVAEGEAWQPMNAFDWKVMQFALFTNADEKTVRLKLWNPYRSRWENQPEDGDGYTHFMKLPEPPAARTQETTQ